MPAKLPPEEARKRRLARLRAWYQKNKPLFAARRKAYREANRESLLAYYHANKIRTREQQPKVRASALWRAALHRAAEKGIVFELSFDRVYLALANGYCEATRLRFNMAQGRGRSPFGPSIDRRDSSKGYTDGNVRIVIWALNAACGGWGEDILWQIVAARWPSRIKEEFACRTISRLTCSKESLPTPANPFPSESNQS